MLLVTQPEKEDEGVSEVVSAISTNLLRGDAVRSQNLLLPSMSLAYVFDSGSPCAPIASGPDSHLTAPPRRRRSRSLEISSGIRRQRKLLVSGAENGRERHTFFRSWAKIVIRTLMLRICLLQPTKLQTRGISAM